MGTENLDTTHSSEFYPLNSDTLPDAPQLWWKIFWLCWNMRLTRLAVGLIFFVSTFFSDVSLLTDSWAIFNLKLKQGVGRGEEQQRERGQVKQYPSAFELTNWQWGNTMYGFLVPLSDQIWTLIRCEGIFSRLSKLNFLCWLRDSPRWPQVTNAGASSYLWNATCPCFSLSEHLRLSGLWSTQQIIQRQFWKWKLWGSIWNLQILKYVDSYQ